MLDQIKEERIFERLKAFFDATERAADHRAGLQIATAYNLIRSKESDRFFVPSDFFPSLKKKADGTDVAEKSNERSTQETVEYLKAGFSVYVPTSFRQRVGLPD